MRTEVLAVDPLRPDPAVLDRAAAVLRAGGLVAFPTETVYGLGANALDEPAVHRIFAAKGRPANNPLIVHVPNAASARALTITWPEPAQALAERFWPGPLTLVLPRAGQVPDAVTAGGTTVAVRVPAHPVALALLERVGLPIAGPSANRSTRLSPTRAEHVRQDLEGQVDLILDAGPTPGGMESTVLDLTHQPPRLLRPGLILPSAIAAVTGRVELRLPSAVQGQPLPSPGLLAVHYAPRTPLERLQEGEDLPRILELARSGLRIGWLPFETLENVPASGLVVVRLPTDAHGYAAGFYDALHQLDAAGVDRIVVTRPPLGEEWMAVQDRLQRAQSQ